MTNLPTDEMVFFRNLMKIDTDKNKAIYSNSTIFKSTNLILHRQM